jgi:peptide/nickel transport system substrate-binding protein
MPVTDYYFQYDDADFKADHADLANATDPAKRSELMKAGAGEDRRRLCQRLPVPAGVRDRRPTPRSGALGKPPTQANDMTAVYWEE